MHFKNHNTYKNSRCARPELVEGSLRALEDILRQAQDERRKAFSKTNNHNGGFTLVEVIISLAITALVLTPIFIMHGMIFQRVNRGANAFDTILYCKELLIEARQKQDPDAQEFTLDKQIPYLHASCTYSLDKSIDQKSSLASLPGLHKETITINWTEQEEKKQERLITFIYKKPEQKKS